MKRLQPFILTLISGFAVYLFDKIWGNKIPWEKVTNISIIEWFNFQLKIYQVILFVIIFTILYFIIRLVKKSRATDDSIYSRQEQKLIEFNSKLIDGILWKWDIYFDYSGKPKIQNLQPYCMNHGNIPMKMSRSNLSSIYACGMANCGSKIASSEYYTPNIKKYRQYIESIVENDWDIIKNSANKL